MSINLKGFDQSTVEENITISVLGTYILEPFLLLSIDISIRASDHICRANDSYQLSTIVLRVDMNLDGVMLTPNLHRFSSCRRMRGSKRLYGV